MLVPGRRVEEQADSKGPVELEPRACGTALGKSQIKLHLGLI